MASHDFDPDYQMWVDELFTHMIALSFCAKERENYRELEKAMKELRTYYLNEIPDELLNFYEPVDLDETLSFATDVRLDLAFFFHKPELFYGE